MFDTARKNRWASPIVPVLPAAEVPDTMKSQWNGHALVTRTKLLGILERAAGGSDDFSISERALFTACEFWAAVESRRLQD